MEKENRKEENASVINRGTAIIYGLSLGVAFYIMFDNLVLGLCMGVCLSLLFGHTKKN